MKKIILSENKLGIIKENMSDIMSNKLPDYVYQSVKVHNTSLGESPSFPPSNDYDFDYKLLKKRFSEILDNLKKYNLPTDVTEAENLIYKLTRKAVEIETPIRPQLNKLVNNAVMAMFAVPSETILLTCELKDSIEPKNTLRILPEDDGNGDDSYEFADVDEMNNVADIVKQRRFVDSLIQGYSSILSNEKDFYAEFFEEKNLNDLLHLYDLINALNDFLIFSKKEKIDKKNPKLVSYVAVHLGHGDNKTSISSQGLIFPYLLKETIRGFMELFSSHGLPKDNHKAQMIIKMADFTMAEPWDIRLGIPMWEIMFGNKIESNMIPYFFSDYCSLNSKKFFKISKELLAKTKAGKEYINTNVSRISHDVQYNEFLKGIQQKNINASVITDGYMTADDLDNYTISEDGGNIEENSENEYNTPELKQFKNRINLSFDEGLNPFILHNINKIWTFINSSYCDDDKISDEDWSEFENLGQILDNDYEYDDKTIKKAENEAFNILNKYPEVKYQFGCYLKLSHKYMVNQTYNYEKNVDVNKEWLIHFTQDPQGIAEDGFTKSTPNVEDLSVTHGIEDTEGYNFAFIADKVTDREAEYYCGDNLGAVMFHANGVEAYHKGDKQDQVVFWGSTARDIVPIYHGDITDFNFNGVNADKYNGETYIYNCWFILNDKTNRIIYYSDYIEDIVRWVEENWFQYRKLLNSNTLAQNDYLPNSKYRKYNAANSVSEEAIKLKENSENEYSVGEVGNLKNYLNMSDDEHDKEILYNYCYSIYDFIMDDYSDELSEDDLSELNLNHENDDDEANIKILENYPDILEKFLKQYKEYASEYNEDAYSTFDYEKDIDINKDWLIHFTDDPGGIADIGFTSGTYDMQSLAVTGRQKDMGEGYDFAFLADRVGNYEAQYYCGSNRDNWGAVMFHANAVQAYHYGDEQHQVIFWGPSAKDIIPIYHGDASYYVSDEYKTSDNFGAIDDCWYILNEKRNVALYYSEDIEDMVAWVMKNYFQYRKVLNVNSKARMDYSPSSTYYRKTHKGNNF